MTDIFISYKREEKPKARKLARALTECGWKTWWDPALVAGERYDDVIGEELKSCRCAIVLWSKLSVKSKYVLDEASYALNENKLVPILLDKTELPFRFRSLHTLDFSAWDGTPGHANFEELHADLCSKIGKPGKPLVFNDQGGESTDTPFWRARRIVIPAVVAVAVAISITAWQRVDPLNGNNGHNGIGQCFLRVQVNPVDLNDEVFYLERVVGEETKKLPASTITLEPHHLVGWGLNVVWKSDSSASATSKLSGCQDFDSVITSDEKARVSFTVID